MSVAEVVAVLSWIESQVRAWVHLGRGWATYVGPARQNRAHRHHAIQLAWSVGEPLRLNAGNRLIVAPGYLVRAGVPHRVEADPWLRTVYLDPQLRSAQAIAEVHAGTALPLNAAQVAALEAGLRAWVAGDAQAAPADEPVADARHDRLATLRDWLDRQQGRRVLAREAALAVHLSPSRFQHWFTDAFGLPLRPYLRWLRLQQAVRLFGASGSLTQAAHGAGFADSAHLSRSFVATFGVAPSTLGGATIRSSDATRSPVCGVLAGRWAASAT